MWFDKHNSKKCGINCYETATLVSVYAKIKNSRLAPHNQKMYRMYKLSKVSYQSYDKMYIHSLVFG